MAGCAGRAAEPAAAPGGQQAQRGAAAPGGPRQAPASAAAVASQDGLPAIAHSPASPPPAWPGPLPYPIIIADRANDRILEVTPDKRIVWQFPGPQGLPAGARFGDDDDVFFTPGGRTVITNEEHQGTIAEVDYYTRRIVWTYGHYGVERYGNGYLDYPDDAYRLPDGTTVVADIRNCRELFISPDRRILRQWGQEQDGGRGGCPKSSPPRFLGSPNGDTPQPNGDILLSLINGNAVALMSRDGRVKWMAHVPYTGPNAYVSDAQLLPDGDVLTAIYGKPGRIVVFNPRTGRVDWLYDVASGPGELDHPSLAERLPNGNIITNDDYNDRVVVIDPKTKRIVWQYGVTGRPGTAPGYLNTPDGLDVDLYRDWQGWMRTHPGFGVAAGAPGAAPGAVRPNPEAGEQGGA
jgi:hypothetical protein